MALPAPGSQIGMAQVRTELGGSGQQTLSAAGVTLASITAGNEVELSADLGGTSAGDNIVVSFGSTSTPTYTSSLIKSYRPFNHTGHTNPQTIRPYIQFQTSSVSSGTITFCYYINTTGSTPPAPSIPTWTQIANTSSAGFNSSYYIPTSGVLDYNEYMWIGIIISKASYGFVTGTITITTTYAGTGSISSYTRASPFSWSY